MSHLGLTMDEGPRTTRSQRRRRRRRRRSRFGSMLAVFLSLAVVAGLIAAVFFGGRAIFGDRFSDAFAPPDDYPGPGSGEVTVTIEEGASLRSIGTTLADANVVASQEAFVAAAERNPQAAGIQAGEYTLLQEMKASDAVQAMIEATTVIAKVTIPEGFRLRQIVERVTEEASFTADEVQAAIDGSEALPEYADGEAEGFLFPATYDIKADTTAESLVRMMFQRFGTAAKAVDLEAAAAERKLTPREVVTLASIVQREVRRDEDMPRVAGVAYNRLTGACGSRGIPAGLLQMDSTIHYAINDDTDSVFTTEVQRRVDSPYNTYVHKGIPPGPIASPGEAALRAVLAPAEGQDCYFSAVDLETGETKFAVTPEDHAANVAELQAFCRQSDLC
jgi:peptidoglycan lytic transglycosylase G